jgi:hypothetical protein
MTEESIKTLTVWDTVSRILFCSREKPARRERRRYIGGRIEASLHSESESGKGVTR